MSEFNLSDLSGESFGDINEIFFKKDGKSLLPLQSTTPDRISVKDITYSGNEHANTNLTTNTNGNTIIHISKDLLGTEEDEVVYLTVLEERRRNTTSVRNKEFVDLTNGEVVVILDSTEMYNGANLFSVKHSTNMKVITYPRRMFVGREKRFVPKDFYIREAERAIEDTISKYGQEIFEMANNPEFLNETPDGKFLEIVLDVPFDILGDIIVPNKIQIPVKRMFDLEYKMMMLDNVICVDNKIASLIFLDLWF